MRLILKIGITLYKLNPENEIKAIKMKIHIFKYIKLSDIRRLCKKYKLFM